MRGLTPLLLGIFGTFAFSWAGLVAIPNAQIGHLEPQMDEEATDVYPAPESGLVERGRKVYIANGCVYCHTQQVRPAYAAADLDRAWGVRRSAPRDYLFERPALLGRMRMGPDLANVGRRQPADDEGAAPPSATAPSPGAQPPAAPAPAPAAATSAPATAGPAPGAAPAGPPSGSVNTPGSATAQEAPAGAPPTAPAIPGAGAAPSPAAATTAQSAAAQGVGPATTMPGGVPIPYTAPWHHVHLYNPRSITSASIMPSFRFLYETRRVSGERAADALPLSGDHAPPDGWEVVPTYDAKALVAYLMSLDQSHELKEVKAATPPSPPAPGQTVK